MAHKLPVMSQNAHKLTVFESIQHYLTLLDFKKGIRFFYETNRLACFNPIQVPNSGTNTNYFQKNLFNPIICPSLACTG